MFFRKKLLLLHVLTLSAGTIVHAQQSDFCTAITAIIGDAPNKFKNIRGKGIDANMNAITWETGIKVPGAIGERFVSSMGMFYEGAFFQSATITGLRAAYNKCKEQLSACLLPQQYEVSFQDNFNPGLDSFKRVVFTKENTGDNLPAHPPGHVSVEALYNKEMKRYSLVMYIFDR